jgi:ATP-dependent RNA helicase RhlE
VATDIAARGIDIDQLPHVVNYELPNVAEDYVHRIGRTGRAGNEGEAMSLVCVDELKLLKDIERLIKREIPKDIIDGYTPDPSIKAEPITRGRGGQQQRSGRKHNGKRKPNENKAASPGNKQRSPYKGNSNNQNRSGNKSGNRSGNASGNRSSNRSGNR